MAQIALCLQVKTSLSARMHVSSITSSGTVTFTECLQGFNAWPEQPACAPLTTIMLMRIFMRRFNQLLILCDVQSVAGSLLHNNSSLHDACLMICCMLLCACSLHRAFTTSGSQCTVRTKRHSSAYACCRKEA